jgi:excisionase family DNA binding protein
MPRTLTPKGAQGETRFMTCKEAAALLKLSEVSIRRFLTQGKLRRLKCGSRTLLDAAEVFALVEDKTTRTPTAA